MVKKLDIKVRDTVFEPGSSSRKVYYKKTGDTALYKVWLFLDGDDLPYVMSATYRLHSTFPDPDQTIRRTLSNPNCQLVIWTWGLFKIKALIEEKSGVIRELDYQLQYDKELQQKGVEFVAVTS
jgi:transcription initiation factor IIF auxiliary subunit